MNHLVELSKSIGRIAKSLDLFLRDPSNIDREDAITLSNNIVEMRALTKGLEVMWKHYATIAERRGDRYADDPSVIAYRIPGHDMNNEFEVMFHAISTIDRSLQDEEAEINTTNLSKFIDCFIRFRRVALTLAYIATSGDIEYQEMMPIGELGEYLKKPEIPIHVSNDVSELLISDAFALRQFVKNGCHHINIGSYEGTQQPYTVLSSHDNNEGIIGHDRRPLPAERICELFGDYSTTGGGSGLQIVKAIAHFRNGFVEVQTKTQGNPVITYNTIDGVCEDVKSPLARLETEETGSAFTLYVPTS